MKNNEFAIAFSEKEQAEAIKEVSLKIKLDFPKYVGQLIILFTPHYQPDNILKTINLTLNPSQVLGIQSPFLIFEDKIISKGIVACCINKKDLSFQEMLSEASTPQEIEYFLNTSLKKLKKKDFYLLSFLSPKISPSAYLQSMRLSLGKIFNFLGIGYTRKSSSFNSQIVNTRIGEGLVNVAVENIQIHTLRLKGYLPLGKDFTITKILPDKGIILEINGSPAINIYKRYLEEKFDVFLKNKLFTYYPLGIKHKDTFNLISIIDSLEDGSLMYLGDVKAGDSGHIMLFDSDLLLKNLQNELAPLKETDEGLVFIINSLLRKRILGKNSAKEIKSIKKALGNNRKVIGLYSDYFFTADNKSGNIGLRTGDLVITLWQ